MSREPNAAGGPPGRVPGLALGRGVILLAVAVVIGVVLLRSLPTPVPPGAATTTTTQATTPTHSTKPVASGSTTTTTTLAPSKVAVLVANGTSVPSGAGNLANALKALGYDTLPAYDTTAPATASAVYYVSETYHQAAVTLAKVIGVASTSVAVLPSTAPVPKVSGTDVAVVEGPHLAARFANPTSLGTTTSTSTTTSTTGG